MFYIEHGDKYGNTGHHFGFRQDEIRHAVIEAVEEPGVTLRVVAPADFIARWPTVSRFGWVVCAGPARWLTEDERAALLTVEAPHA